VDRVYDPLVMSWAKPLFSTLYTRQVDEAAYLVFRGAAGSASSCRCGFTTGNRSGASIP